MSQNTNNSPENNSNSTNATETSHEMGAQTSSTNSFRPPSSSSDEIVKSRWDNDEEDDRPTKTPTKSRRKSVEHKQKLSITPSPNNNNTTASDDDKCAICLKQIENKAKPEHCAHHFCYVCLSEWAKVRLSCPLCKVEFQQIHYNFRANGAFDSFLPEVPLTEGERRRRRLRNGQTISIEQQELERTVRALQMRLDSYANANLTSITGRPVDERSTMNVVQHESDNQATSSASNNSQTNTTSTIAQWLSSAFSRTPTRFTTATTSNTNDTQTASEQHMTDAISTIMQDIENDRNEKRDRDRRAHSFYARLLSNAATMSRGEFIGHPAFRRLVYERGLRAQPLSQEYLRGRTRRLTPHYFRKNQTAFIRLVPWIMRDLRVLTAGEAAYRRDKRIEKCTNNMKIWLEKHDLAEDGVLKSQLFPFLTDHTSHFLYELQQFALSPCETIEEYDAVVTYRREGTEVYAVRESSGSNLNTTVTLDDHNDDSNSPMNVNNNDLVNGGDELQIVAESSRVRAQRQHRDRMRQWHETAIANLREQATSQRFVENFLASNQWLQTPVGGSVGNLDEALMLENGTNNNDEVTVVTPPTQNAHLKQQLRKSSVLPSNNNNIATTSGANRHNNDNNNQKLRKSAGGRRPNNNNSDQDSNGDGNTTTGALADDDDEEEIECQQITRQLRNASVRMLSSPIGVAIRRNNNSVNVTNVPTTSTNTTEGVSTNLRRSTRSSTINSTKASSTTTTSLYTKVTSSSTINVRKQRKTTITTRRQASAKKSKVLNSGDTTPEYHNSDNDDDGDIDEPTTTSQLLHNTRLLLSRQREQQHSSNDTHQREQQWTGPIIVDVTSVNDDEATTTRQPPMLTRLSPMEIDLSDSEITAATSSSSQQTVQHKRRIFDHNDVLTLSSDSELSSYEGEVEVLCEMKPKHMRTPPLVSLEDDDDDVRNTLNDNDDIHEYSPELITTTTATSSIQKHYTRSPRKRDSRRALSESPDRKKERRSNDVDLA